MKLIIDIPDNTYTDIQEHKRYTDFTILDLIKAIRHSTPIPDDATNGDVIRAMFPNLKITMMDDIVSVMGQHYEFNNFYPLDFWNALYQKGGKE